jgi:hypothetical protein
MSNSVRIKTASLIAIILLTARAAPAQPSTPNVEVGAQLSLIDIREPISEKPPGIGGRFTYNITGHIAIDTEVNYFSTHEVILNRTQGPFERGRERAVRRARSRKRRHVLGGSGACGARPIRVRRTITQQWQHSCQMTH